jgi:hypothetical protein
MSCSDASIVSAGAALLLGLTHEGADLSRCAIGSWCFHNPAGDRQLDLRRKNVFVLERDERFMLKVMPAGIKEGEIRQESSLLTTLCKRANRLQSRLASRIPWTSRPFQFTHHGNSSKTQMVGLLQERVAGTTGTVHRNPVHFAQTMREFGWSSARNSARDAVLWASFLDPELVCDFQYLRGPNGELWFIDPGNVELPAAPLNPSARLLPATLTFPRQSLVRPASLQLGDEFWPRAPPRCAHEAEAAHVYQLARQRVTMLNHALFAALVAANATDAVEASLCRHALCDLGCVVLTLPHVARTALLHRLGDLGGMIISGFDSVAASGLRVQALATDTIPVGGGGCGACAKFKTGFDCSQAHDRETSCVGTFAFEEILLCALGAKPETRCESDRGKQELHDFCKERPACYARLKRLQNVRMGNRSNGRAIEWRGLDRKEIDWKVQQPSSLPVFQQTERERSAFAGLPTLLRLEHIYPSELLSEFDTLCHGASNTTTNTSAHVRAQGGLAQAALPAHRRQVHRDRVGGHTPARASRSHHRVPDYDRPRAEYAHFAVRGNKRP